MDVKRSDAAHPHVSLVAASPPTIFVKTAELAEHPQGALGEQVYVVLETLLNIVPNNTINVMCNKLFIFER